MGFTFDYFALRVSTIKIYINTEDKMQFIDLKKQYQLIKDDVQMRLIKFWISGNISWAIKSLSWSRCLVSTLEASYCIGVCDGTKVLLIALMALDCAGDEVIVPAFTLLLQHQWLRY